MVRTGTQIQTDRKSDIWRWVPHLKNTKYHKNKLYLVYLVFNFVLSLCFRVYKTIYGRLSFKTQLRATFKIWNFYFAQILTWIVEKQHVLTPFNFVFKFSHCLTLFPIFLVHVNWIVFYATAHLFKFYYQQILCKICHVVTKAEHEVIILYEFGKWWVDKTVELHNHRCLQMFSK